ncbi:bifunctional phosphoribosyl-AMP cyclohydrolase/phosphoribosyl-ATP diphosphatase HisIE [Thermoflexus sp.]|uniref:bifunctional phosphoribosyl-AMP cyclohydrolase/phosphoribosyl-ATP diphosphatase HisIE n=1 Tax=Thermoflexus sp. TaxID=1969742 RepID=UPI0025FE5F77|nr:bifunctional phosphoribosyl-AMP cyclohydrolase/phosphoribosyl-ATP diphosphatase HisIE [Thermoflexus sp.]MDW8181433.1 bifunctional phosphoribosyl-AMP cyclohydrolase/phosphoribosyl-ATP diphosphatase HisIE [Anaerolineae bacterium]MCS6962847.1 bifunctional phosphoribosyl-AMP cyclohydrolase/phosphoribosyl-ATP diphosphatase HisIE [Thermoflexus sp.]MCS7351974.1 bifunctional phosphoribosyl-AMP cyclohydrolase/phosphoribosyl-ATP diphosphatase HisIE [Thermoflexus sp.]MCX7690863.1 bifunctional phosphori
MTPTSTPSGWSSGPDPGELRPAVVQDARTGRVLMLGWVNDEALQRTRETGMAHFWSRSRRRLWRKGETSGNVLRVVEIRLDCDGDAVLIQAIPAGPTCHTGQPSCFHREPDGTELLPPPGQILHRLEEAVRDRQRRPAEGSYTARLFAAGLDEIVKKIGEEAIEVALALRHQSDQRSLEEAADLLYMLTVGLVARGLSWDAVLEVLAERRGLSRLGGSEPEHASGLSSSESL